MVEWQGGGSLFQHRVAHSSLTFSLPDTIYGEAGKVFAARKANNPQPDFNTEIWYLPGDPMSAGFSALRGMTKERVARAMGDFIVRYINSQPKPYPWKPANAADNDPNGRSQDF